jgi:alanine-synthesizing transaminase
MFSSRLPPLAANPFSLAVNRLRRDGGILLDLTETNPTRVGLPGAGAGLSALADPRAARYCPDPRGIAPARAAVARAYDETGGGVDPDRIVLTASTSEAYSILFKLLCNPDDEVLVPQPSYPLFELLTKLDAVRPVPYRLRYHDEWSIDRASLEAALTPRSRALLVVNPNNPTGSMLRGADREWMARLAADAGLAIVADEVFADYPLSPRADATSWLNERRALTFTLGGLSKSAGLPQMKLAWIVMSGPPARVDEARDRIDVIADTYLSVSTPVQLAAGRLMTAGADVRTAIRRRLTDNLARLRAEAARSEAVTLFEPEGGWSAVLHAPRIPSEEALVLGLLAEDGVIVHPGYFFDFPVEGFFVVSLLPEPATFDEGISRLVRRLAGTSA